MRAHTGLSRLTRSILAMLMVAAVGGSAIAFATGVRFTPRQACDDQNVSYGATCTDENPKLKKKVKVTSFKRSSNGLSLKIKNGSDVKITGKAKARVQRRNGKFKTIRKKFSIAPGGKLVFSKKISNLLGGRVTVTVTDGNGHTATLKKSFGSFKKPT